MNAELDILFMFSILLRCHLFYFNFQLLYSLQLQFLIFLLHLHLKIRLRLCIILLISKISTLSFQWTIIRTYFDKEVRICTEINVIFFIITVIFIALNFKSSSILNMVFDMSLNNKFVLGQVYLSSSRH